MVRFHCYIPPAPSPGDQQDWGANVCATNPIQRAEGGDPLNLCFKLKHLPVYIYIHIYVESYIILKRWMQSLKFGYLRTLAWLDGIFTCISCKPLLHSGTTQCFWTSLCEKDHWAWATWLWASICGNTRRVLVLVVVMVVLEAHEEFCTCHENGSILTQYTPEN